MDGTWVKSKDIVTIQIDMNPCLLTPNSGFRSNVINKLSLVTLSAMKPENTNHSWIPLRTSGTV